MSREPEEEKGLLENVDEIIENLSKELQDLYSYRDLFFENHPIDMALDKNRLVDNKKEELIRKIEEIDVEKQIPFPLRPKFLYLKGRCYNINPTFDPRAIYCLNRAVKLDPRLADAWNELGECYWKYGSMDQAKASFEGALLHERNRLALRCLSIMLRQENVAKNPNEAAAAIAESVELAKEAVAQDIKDGLSWTVLGNAYLCQFFTLSQDPGVLKACLSAYKQAMLDPVAKGLPDLYYNKAIALKYEENYSEALKNFQYASSLDPLWEPPRQDLESLITLLNSINTLMLSKGKIKIKKLTQMVKNMDTKMLGVYGPNTVHSFGNRTGVKLERVTLGSLQVGTNEGKVVVVRVVGSVHSENAVPFTFVAVDQSMQSVCVTVYNWADGCGVIVGDCVCIPEPKLTLHKFETETLKYDFKSIRLNTPMHLLVNGKLVSMNQFAMTKLTSTYEIH